MISPAPPGAGHVSGAVPGCPAAAAPVSEPPPPPPDLPSDPDSDPSPERSTLARGPDSLPTRGVSDPRVPLTATLITTMTTTMTTLTSSPPRAQSQP